VSERGAGGEKDRPRRATRTRTRGGKPFDATTKYLLERDPAAWLAYVGVEPTGPAAVVDSDVSTLAADVDKAIRVAGRRPWLVHLEFQSGPDRRLAERLRYYNTLLGYRHRLPVQSAVVLLRREADARALTGLFRSQLPSGEVYDEFRYRVVRVWQQPVDQVLAGDLATLPLAPLAAGADAILPDVVRRMGERLGLETTPADAAQLWTAAYVLMGLRYDEAVTSELLRGVRNMRDSVTYQAILREGRAEGEAWGRADEARRIVLRLGSLKFGPANTRARATLDRVTDVDQLEQLTDRVLTAASWDELLSTS
jgi:predicted transposase YdaD